MQHVNSTFERYNLSTTSVVSAVKDVGQLVREGEVDAAVLIEQLIGCKVSFENDEEALTIAQAIVEYFVKNNLQFDDSEVVIKYAEKRKDKVHSGATVKHILAARGQRDDQTATPSQLAVNRPVTEMKQVSEAVELRVEVKADGSIKKGGKQVMALALYTKLIGEAAEPLTNQQFIQVLMNDLGMSKAGATTYASNAKASYQKGKQ